MTFPNVYKTGFSKGFWHRYRKMLDYFFFVFLAGHFMLRYLFQISQVKTTFFVYHFAQNVITEP